MDEEGLAILPTYMLVSAVSAASGEMEMLELVLAAGPDHFQAVAKGEHPGVRFQVLMSKRQHRDLVDCLERAIDLPDQRPN